MFIAAAFRAGARRSTFSAARAMDPDTATKRLQRLASIRRWEDAHLPIYGSLLGHDLVLLLAQLYVKRRHFMLKEVYCSLPYSENAIRLHLKRLLREGWLVHDQLGQDRRFRFVTPSARLLEALECYLGAEHFAPEPETPAKPAADPAQGGPGSWHNGAVNRPDAKEGSRWRRE